MQCRVGSVLPVSRLQHVPAPAPFPLTGRTFTSRRTVRLGDVTPKGRLRLDATARYLQDIATDDAVDGNYDDPHGWVVRRTEMWVHSFPKYLDRLWLTTWCGGVGSHWAERRTRIEVEHDGALSVATEAAALWVRVDLQTLKPLALTEHFRGLIGEAAAGRKVSARLHVGRGLADATAAHSSSVMPLRFSDFDAVGHLNNAVYWEPLEEYLAAHRDRRAPLHAVLEHHASVEPHPATGHAARPSGTSRVSAQNATCAQSSGELTVFVHELGDRVVLRLVDRTTTAALIQLVND